MLTVLCRLGITGGLRILLVLSNLVTGSSGVGDDELLLLLLLLLLRLVGLDPSLRI